MEENKKDELLAQGGEASENMAQADGTSDTVESDGNVVWRTGGSQTEIQSVAVGDCRRGRGGGCGFGSSRARIIGYVCIGGDLMCARRLYQGV